MQGRIYNSELRGWCVRYHEREINPRADLFKTNEIPLLTSQIILAEKNFGTGKFSTKIEFEIFYDCLEDKNLCEGYFLIIFQ